MSFGLSLSRPTLELSSSDPVLDMLAKLQLSAVGVRLPDSSSVRDPSPALWKSPKSPNPSKLVSGSSEPEELKVKGSVPLAAAESENGPKAS